MARRGAVRVIGVYNNYVRGVWDGKPPRTCRYNDPRAQWWAIEVWEQPEGKPSYWYNTGVEYDCYSHAKREAERLLEFPPAERADRAA